VNFTAPVVLLSGAEPAPARASSSQMLTEKAVAARLGVTARTLQRWRTTGDGPAWIRIGPRMIRYSEAGVSAWAAARTYAHRAAELAGDVA
jgi:predicted DNA-binding transcriptional regulator AlpA